MRQARIRLGGPDTKYNHGKELGRRRGNHSWTRDPHAKQGLPSMVRGRLAQTVKEEKDISDESNSLGLRHNKLKVIGFRKHYLLLQQTRQTIPKP